MEIWKTAATIDDVASQVNNDVQSEIPYNPHSNPVEEIMNDGQPTTHSVWDAWESINEVSLGLQLKQHLL